MKCRYDVTLAVEYMLCTSLTVRTDREQSNGDTLSQRKLLGRYWERIRCKACCVSTHFAEHEFFTRFPCFTIRARTQMSYLP